MIDLGGMSWTDTMIEMVFTKKRSKLNKKSPQVFIPNPQVYQ